MHCILLVFFNFWGNFKFLSAYMLLIFFNSQKRIIALDFEGYFYKYCYNIYKEKIFNFRISATQNAKNIIDVEQYLVPRLNILPSN